MLDQYAALHSTGASRLVDLSARPDSPAVADHRRGSRPARQARAGLAAALRRLAGALEPRPTGERNRPATSPACR